MHSARDCYARTLLWLRAWLAISAIDEFFYFWGDMIHSRRYAGLDALRGIAALIVVVHHGLLVSPVFTSAHGGPPAELDVWHWALINTPLRLLWAGPEAVIVFFVLSGFVLTLPVLKSGRFSWMEYYPKRLIRLYVPVIGSVGVALLASLLVPRGTGPELSAWLNAHEAKILPLGIAKEAFLLLGTGTYNSPLWSLAWEVFFSLLLPIYVYSLLVIRQHQFIVAGLLVTLCEVGQILNIGALTFLPMFGVGVLLAMHSEAIKRWWTRLSPAGQLGLAIGSILLMGFAWFVPGLEGTVSPTVLGGSGLLIACMSSPRADFVGELPAISWLGSRSFSLYLVHEPLIVSAAILLKTTNPAVVMIVSLPVMLIFTEVFYKLVEAPSHRLAGNVGGTLRRLRNFFEKIQGNRIASR